MKPMNDKTKLKIARRAMKRVIHLLDENWNVARSGTIINSEDDMRRTLIQALSSSQPNES